jgi:hypothetical protein
MNYQDIEINHDDDLNNPEVIKNYEQLIAIFLKNSRASTEYRDAVQNLWVRILKARKTYDKNHAKGATYKSYIADAIKYGIIDDTNPYQHCGAYASRILKAFAVVYKENPDVSDLEAISIVARKYNYRGSKTLRGYLNLYKSGFKFVPEECIDSETSGYRDTSMDEYLKYKFEKPKN